MGKRIVVKIFVALLSASVVVPMFDCFDVGAADKVSLQCRENTFMAADLHPVLIDTGEVSDDVDVPLEQAVVVTDIPEVSYTDPFSDLIDSNTYTIEVSSDEEPIDESLFTYDGTDVFVKVEMANLRAEPNTEADVIECYERGTAFLRISYGSDWSRVRSEDGTEGFLLSSLITDDIEEALPEEETESEEVTILEETGEITETAPSATPTPVITGAPVTTETSVPETSETTVSVPETSAETSVETSASETYESYTEEDCFKIVYATCVLNVRTGPGTGYDMVRVLQPGEMIDVIAVTSNGWFKTALGNYVKCDLTSETPPATPTPVPASEETVDTSSAPSASYSDFASYCLQFNGIPYRYGGASPEGFDCSGFVSYVYANYYGISLPHDAAGIATMGSPVSMDSMQCGDVLCHDYNGDGAVDHVSIYIGNGTYVHASNSRSGVITSTYAGTVTTVRRFI